MKNKKAIGILICMLLTITSFSVTGFEIKDDPFKTAIKLDELIVDRRLESPPVPGYCPNPIPDLFIPEIKIDLDIPNRDISNENDVVIQLLNNLDETLYLGFLEELVSFGTRVTGTPACTQAGEWIYSEFANMGLDVRYHNWSYWGYSGHNIEGTLPGTNESSDEIYIICGHYDTVSNCPGADDDGSGVAAVLAAAYLMKDYSFEHTLRFVAFDGEEEGLLGSHEYVDEAYNNGDNIIGTLNADMIGNTNTANGGKNIKIYENSASHWLTVFTQDISNVYDDYIDLNVIPSGSSSGSDHYYFWQFGYDAIFYHEYEFCPYYHSSQDTIANMNITYATKSSRLILATLAELSVPLFSNSPPNTPTIDGETNGEAGTSYSYTFSATDPDENDLYYYIEWGDNTSEEWVGPYSSGEDVIVEHTWEEQGEYTIRSKVKDIYDAESDWATLEVVMPVNQIVEITILQLILDRFPNAFPIIRYILGL